MLLAVCDAYSRFIVVDVGDSEKQSDGGVLSYSCLGKHLKQGPFIFLYQRNSQI